VAIANGCFPVPGSLNVLVADSIRLVSCLWNPQRPGLIGQNEN
jgi:hypothetical protein